jgi:hypothetical protein
VDYRLEVGATVTTEARALAITVPFSLQLWSLALLIALFLAVRYVKRSKRLKSGLHKKCDDDC